RRGRTVGVAADAAGGFLGQQGGSAELRSGVLQADAVPVNRQRHVVDDVPHETGAPGLAFLFLQAGVAGDEGLGLVDGRVARGVALGAGTRTFGGTGADASTAGVLVEDRRERSGAFGEDQ